MKKIFVLSILLLANIMVWAADKNSLKASNVMVPEGTATIELPIELNNDNQISDFQFDIVLPEGLSLAVKAGYSLVTKIDRCSDECDHEVSFKQQTDGSVRIMCTSVSGDAFSGKSGTALTVMLKASSTLAPGSYSIALKNIVLSNAAKTFPVATTTSVVTVQNTAKLTFTLDGEQILSKVVPVGNPIAVPEVEEKTGYTFSGWGEVPATMPDHDVEFTGHYNVNQYTVTFNVDDEAYKVLTLDYGSAITAPDAPTKTGYTFSGWKSVAATVPAGNLVYDATFTINKHTLKYVVDGEDYKTFTLDYGTVITAEAAPSKTGYSFSGWSEIPATMPDENVTVSGAFNINQYTVTFNVDAEAYKVLTLDYGSAITAPDAPTKTGYTFSGWKSVAATVPAGNLVYDATFTVNKHTLKYVVDGEVYKTSTLDYGTVITAEAAPSKTGYSFSGWSEIPATMPDEDVIVSGAFNINQYTVTFNVDGETYKVLTLDYGTAITVPDAPAKEGYTFSGWAGVAATVPAGNLTYDAVFTKGNFILTYTVDGVEYKKLSLDFGDAITAEPAPTKEGYTFSGWSEVPATMPAGNFTIIGSFTVNKYKVTFKVDDEVYKETEVEYGAAIPLPDDPAKEGYTFSGWGEMPAKMPAEGVTLIAQFEKAAMYGDVNEDGVINAADVVSVYNFIAKGEASGLTFEKADVNEDTIVNAADVITIYNIIIGN